MAMTQLERRAETRARLITAAVALFAEHGPAAVSVDAVAATAGRTSGAVYDHFVTRFDGAHGERQPDIALTDHHHL